MSNTVKHTFVSNVADSADTTLVRPSDWNHEHTFSGGVLGQHLEYNAANSDHASWQYGSGAVNVRNLGAVGDGSTDDTAAFQTALDTGGRIEVPYGNYRITSTLNVTTAVHMEGIGTSAYIHFSPNDTRGRQIVLVHDFNGTFFNITGLNNNIPASSGLAFENLILLQNYGDGTAAAGKCFDLLATNGDYRPSWTKFLRLHLTHASGKDHWTHGFYVDGGPSTPTGGIRDYLYDYIYIQSGSHTTSAITIYSGVSHFFRNIQIEGDASTNHTVLTADPADIQTQRCRFWGYNTTGDITLDYASFNQFFGCSCDGLTLTNHSDQNYFFGHCNTVPVTSPVSDRNFVFFDGTFYHTDSTHPIRVRSTSGVQAILQLDGTAGVDAKLQLAQDEVAQWNMTVAGSDTSFSFNREGVGNVWTVGISGQFIHRRGYGQSSNTPNFADPITIDLLLSNVFIVAATSNINFTISNPSNFNINQQFTIRVMNTSGGALGTATWSAKYQLQGAWVQPANGSNRSITFMMDENGNKAYEISRVTADVPN